MKIKYCKKCVMPNTRPGLKISKDGICTACKHYEIKDKINWEERWELLKDITDKYRNCNGDYYDCIITASSGKDSYYQIHILKEILNMNPLIVSVGNFTSSKTGIENWNNMLNQFGVDAIQLNLNPKMCKRMFKKGLERGIPTWYFDLAIYSWPINMASKFNIPLIVYGENTSYEYGGPLTEESPMAFDQIHNDAVKPIPIEDWFDDDINSKNFAATAYPKQSDISKLYPIYLSYFTKWSGYEHMEYAKSRGFKTLDDSKEWHREGYLEQYDQIDSIGYNLHCWFKFPKFGHSRVTDVASIWIREGRITREEAVEYVISEDWKLDGKILRDFLNYVEYPEYKFWQVVDRYANTEMLSKKDGYWKLNDKTIERLRNP